MGFFKELFSIFFGSKPKKRTERKKSKPRIFIAADLHLDHKNIIRYCHRPFRSVQQMNSRLVSNWNRIVRKNDVVYFLGDLAMKRPGKGTDYWYRRLNGRIKFIQGNHDRSRRIKMYRTKKLTYQGETFLLIHDPAHIPKSWKGWVIHGHKHNNRGAKLVNKERKWINASIELTNYRPINIATLRQKMR